MCARDDFLNQLYLEVFSRISERVALFPLAIRGARSLQTSLPCVCFMCLKKETRKLYPERV